MKSGEKDIVQAKASKKSLERLVSAGIVSCAGCFRCERSSVVVSSSVAAWRAAPRSVLPSWGRSHFEEFTPRRAFLHYSEEVGRMQRSCAVVCFSLSRSGL